MSLFLHLFIHFLFALLAGLIVFLIWRKPIVSFVGGILGGLLIDMDHLLDYLFTFGFNFRLDYFISGYQFLKSDKIYVLFHGWEYVIILLAVGYIIKNIKLKSFIFALAIGAFFHLSSDVVLNGMSLKFYSIIFRAKNGFEIEKMGTPDEWQKHLIEKSLVNF